MNIISYGQAKSKIKVNGKTFTCDGVWWKGNKIVSYDFIEDGTNIKITREYDYICKLIKEGKIELMQPELKQRK